ncbi:hypothetical protein ACQ4PT_037773 [Festuca glaucescens]
MDVLHLLFERATADDLFAHLAPCGLRHRTSMYADDAVTFLKPDRLDLLTCAAIVEDFGETSRLRTNLAKCSVHPIRCSPQQIELAHDILRCEVATWPLNTKNVEVLKGEEHVATVLPDETIDIGGAAGAGEDASGVPDQETGVFVPADSDTAATHGAAADMPTAGKSVLDQAVFVREEEMEDVERPAIDMASDNDCSQNYY